MGQGSRSALPIVGNFIKAVWKDKRFMKYHAKWPVDDDIDKSLYQCQGYWTKPKRKVDTVYVNRNDEPVDVEGDNFATDEGEPMNGAAEEPRHHESEGRSSSSKSSEGEGKSSSHGSSSSSDKVSNL